MASTSRGSRQSDGVAQGLGRLANAAAAASSPARQTDHSPSTDTPPRSITASNEWSAVSGLSVRSGASVGAPSTPAKRTAPEESERADESPSPKKKPCGDESPSPKKKHPVICSDNFYCDKSIIFCDSAGWAGEENDGISQDDTIEDVQEFELVEPRASDAAAADPEAQDQADQFEVVRVTHGKDFSVTKLKDIAKALKLGTSGKISVSQS